jgi:transposase
MSDIEASMRGKPANELRIRQKKAKPLLRIYEAWLKTKLEALSSKSDTAMAIDYSLKQRRPLTLYCGSGTLGPTTTSRKTCCAV